MLWGLYELLGAEEQPRLLCRDIPAATPPSTATSQHEEICGRQKNTPPFSVGKRKNLCVSAEDEHAVSICDGMH